MRIRAAMIVLVAAGFMLVASHAGADDRKRGQAIFKEGLAEMMEGNYASGCPKIESAYRLTKGPGALFTLAECYAKWDKPATALGHYRAYLKVYAKLPAGDRRRQEERAKLASTQVAALSTLVPTLQIMLPDEERQGAVVTVDGQTVSNDALDSALQLEIGTHRVVVTATGGRTVEQSFNLVEGAHRRWEVQFDSTPRPDPRPDPVPPEPPKDEWTSTQIAGLIIGGTGVGVLALGAVTGGLAVGQRGTVDDHCTELICDQEGLDAADTGRTLGDVSTATLVIGGAALVTGVVLLLVGGEGDTTEAMQLTPDGLRFSF